MANPKILYTDLSTYTLTLSGATANASYPLSNLQTYEPTLSFRPIGVPYEFYVVIDFGSAKICNNVVVGNLSGDFYSQCEPYIQYAANSSFTGSSTGDVGILTRMGTTDTFYKEFAGVSKRYWRLKVINDAISVIDISNIFLNSALTFTTPYDFGYKTENKEYQTSESITLDGTIRTSQVFAGRRIYELKFRLQNSSLRTGFQTFVETVRGKMYPFYFFDDSGTLIRYMHLTDDYVPVTTQFYGANNIDNLKMREHLTS